MPKGYKKTHKDFLNDLEKVNPFYKNIVFVDEYKTRIGKIRCKCKLCNDIWETTPKQLIQDKQKCPNCSRKTKPLTNDEYVERVKQGNSHYDKFIFLSKYKSMSVPIKLKCKECGHIWKTRPFDLATKGVDCPSCSGNVTMTDEAFRKKLKSVNKNFSDIVLLSKYKGVFERVDCKCIVCGHIWSPMATSLLQGSGCPECTKKRLAVENIKYLLQYNPPIMSQEEFVSKYKRLNPYSNQIILLSDYKGTFEDIKCKCTRCGNTFTKKGTTLLSKSGCPFCCHSSTSFMEQFIYLSLCMILKDKVVMNRTKDIIGKELDIYVPDYSLAVEIGSWNWHKKLYTRDIQKIEDCKELGIKLYVFYDLCDEAIKVENVYAYRYELATEKGYTTLKKIVNIICDENNILNSLTDSDYDYIIERSYLNSQTVTHEEFLNKLKLANKDYNSMHFLSRYQSTGTNIRWKCLKCGGIWDMKPYALLKGCGCRHCKSKQKHTNSRKKDLIIEWRKNNPCGNKRQCHLDTKIAYATVLKWWDSVS